MCVWASLEHITYLRISCRCVGISQSVSPAGPPSAFAHPRYVGRPLPYPTLPGPVRLLLAPAPAHCPRGVHSIPERSRQRWVERAP